MRFYFDKDGNLTTQTIYDAQKTANLYYIKPSGLFYNSKISESLKSLGNKKREALIPNMVRGFAGSDNLYGENANLAIERIRSNQKSLSPAQKERVIKAINTIESKAALIKGEEVKNTILEEVNYVRNNLENNVIVTFSPKAGIISKQEYVLGAAYGNTIAIIDGFFNYPDLKDNDDYLAEMLFHEILAKCFPEKSHSDHRARYMVKALLEKKSLDEIIPEEEIVPSLAGMQRELFGKENLLGNVLKKYLRDSLDSASSAVNWVDKSQYDLETKDILGDIGFITKFPKKLFLYINKTINTPQSAFITWEYLLHLKELNAEAELGDGLIQLPQGYLSQNKNEKSAILIYELAKLIYPEPYGAAMVKQTLIHETERDNISKWLISLFLCSWVMTNLVKDGYIREAKEYSNYQMQKFKNSYNEFEPRRIDYSKIQLMVTLDFFINYIMHVAPFKFKGYSQEASENLTEIGDIFGPRFKIFLKENIYKGVISLIKEKVEPLIEKNEIYPDIFSFKELTSTIHEIVNSSSSLGVEQKQTLDDISDLSNLASMPKTNDKGGIDFNALPIQTQTMPGASSASMLGTVYNKAGTVCAVPGLADTLIRRQLLIRPSLA